MSCQLGAVQARDGRRKQPPMQWLLAGLSRSEGQADVIVSYTVVEVILMESSEILCS